MTLELVPIQSQHIPEAGRIFYEAFYQISTSHGFQPDVPGVEVAIHFMDLMSSRPGFYGVVALLDGRPVGSNFLWLMDAVAGIGPITVDPASQGHGVGRALMTEVLRYAESNGIRQVRLMQDAYNTTSLSLYASLGFDAQAEVAEMQYTPEATETAKVGEAGVRAIAASDAEATTALCTRLYRTGRRNELAAIGEMGSPTFVRERDGRIAGYLAPGIIGHGVAESEEDALVLVHEAARIQSARIRFFCPLSEASLFRQMLRAGCRVRKVMTLMSIGPYEEPDVVWMPSVIY